ncbi:membrane protein [Gordonia phage Mollymur]|uniref:Membrane protein n=1 Tax=Gordonia phage Mollymur TaxID=2590895 RepID=A0A4Y6EJD0_9CAUD|nr:membrane protein [Gordonia phage Mollymur]QDF15424.1 membrane protein [Gordonia phage Mollymur]
MNYEDPVRWIVLFGLIAIAITRATRYWRDRTTWFMTAVAFVVPLISILLSPGLGEAVLDPALLHMTGLPNLPELLSDLLSIAMCVLLLCHVAVSLDRGDLITSITAAGVVGIAILSACYAISPIASDDQVLSYRMVPSDAALNIYFVALGIYGVLAGIFFIYASIATPTDTFGERITVAAYFCFGGAMALVGHQFITLGFIYNTMPPPEAFKLTGRYLWYCVGVTLAVALVMTLVTRRRSEAGEGREAVGRAIALR